MDETVVCAQRGCENTFSRPAPGHRGRGRPQIFCADCGKRNELKQLVQANDQPTMPGLIAFLKARVKQARGRARVKELDFDIDWQFALDLWKKQGGRCALTGMQLTHRLGVKGDPCALTSGSLDQILPSGGYTPENVQLVCKGINALKNKHSDEEVAAFLAAFRAAAADPDPAPAPLPPEPPPWKPAYLIRFEERNGQAAAPCVL